MKTLIITDTHFGARNDSLVFSEYFAKFYEEVLFPFIEREKPGAILHGGDVFDRRKYINFLTLNTTRKIFDRLNGYGIPVHIIVGNHDCFWKNTNAVNSPIELLQGYENFNIYTETTEVALPDGTPILLVPWINEENEEQTLRRIRETTASICVGHFEIVGFEEFRGHVNKDRGFTPSLFEHFHTVLSGHFHHKSESGNIRYLGAPYEMVWSDCGDDRGFHVLETPSRRIDFVENPLRIFRKLSYADADKTLEELCSVDFEGLKNLYVRIVVEQKTNPYFFELFLERVYAANPADVSILDGYAEDILESESEDAETIELSDTLTILSECAETSTASNKDSLKNLLKTLYLEAIELDIAKE